MRVLNGWRDLGSYLGGGYVTMFWVKYSITQTCAYVKVDYGAQLRDC